MIKKTLSIIAFVALCLAYPLAVKQSQATVSITSNVKFGACATNFTRVVPNLCQRNSGAGEVWSATAGCVVHVLTTVPSTATYVNLVVTYDVFSTNAINNKTVTMNFYNDGTCATSIQQLISINREFAAVVANTEIYRADLYIPVKIFSGSVVTNTVFTNTGAATAVALRVSGYYD